MNEEMKVKARGLREDLARIDAQMSRMQMLMDSLIHHYDACEDAALELRRNDLRASCKECGIPMRRAAIEDFLTEQLGPKWELS